MNRLIPILLLLIALPLAACYSPPPLIQTENAVGTVTHIVERHDAYATADGSLEDPVAVLAQSARLQTAFETMAELPPESVRDDALAVADRHDAYVHADPALADMPGEPPIPPLEKRVALRSTALLRRLVTQ